MNVKREHDHDDYHDHNDRREHDNDNGANRAPVAAAAMGSTALTSLTALGAVLNAVDTASVVGRSGLPMLTFRKEGDGTWSFGQRKTIPEDDSRWAVNPTSFKWGFICFNNDNKPTERLVPVSQPKPDVTELPDTGFEWHEQWAVSMKCLSGTDAGTEVGLQTDDCRWRPGHRGTDRGDTRSPQWWPARWQGFADRAAGEGLIPSKAVWPRLDAAADDR